MSRVGSGDNKACRAILRKTPSGIHLAEQMAGAATFGKTKERKL